MVSEIQQVLTINFVAAAASLSFSYVCMHPLDTVKTRIQADSSFSWNRLLLSKEMYTGLGRGLLTSAIGAAGLGGVRFSFYELSKSKLAIKKKAPLTFSDIFWCSTIGDIASSIVKVPRENIIAKLQINHYKTDSFGPSFVIKRILAEEGVRGFFKGYWTIAARDIPFIGILMCTHEELKAFHQKVLQPQSVQLKNRTFNKGQLVAGSVIESSKITLPISISVLYGGISGFLAAYLTAPLDVVRTRLITQNSKKQINLKAMVQNMLSQQYMLNRNRNVSKSIIIYKTLFAGAMTRSIWWFGISGIFFPVYESLKVFLA